MKKKKLFFEKLLGKKNFLLLCYRIENKVILLFIFFRYFLFFLD